MTIKTYFNDLPDCVVIKIFKYLSSTVEIWRARNVCIRWYNLSADNELWRVCNLSKFKFDDLSLLVEIQKYTPLEALKYLEINNKVITTDVLSVFLEVANQLNGLRLNGCSIKQGKVRLSYVLESPFELRYLDVRQTCGDLGFMENILTVTGPNIKVLGLSGTFGRHTIINGQPYLHYLQNLRMLECHDCTWMNDEAIASIANYCPQLESLNVTKCLNIQGRTLNKVLTQCRNLKTLILRRTSIREDELLKPSWSNLKIKELDIANCYYLNEESVSKMVCNLAGKLEYLCCAMNNDLLLNLTNTKKPLKYLELRRRHDVDLKSIVNFISTCDQLEALDVSLVPIEIVPFKRMLPHLPNIRWLSMAGHEVLNTYEILKLIPKHNKKIEEIGINFYHALSDESFGQALLQFISSCNKLKKICIEGNYMKEIVEKVKMKMTTDRRFDNSLVQFCNPSDFKLPSPRHSVDTFTEEFSCKPLNFNFNRGRGNQPINK